MNTPGGWGLFEGWLLKSSGQAAVLVVLVFAVQWLLRHKLSPRWRYALWWLVVARLLMPVSVPGPVSVFNWLGWHGSETPIASVEKNEPIGRGTEAITQLPEMAPKFDPARFPRSEASEAFAALPGKTEMNGPDFPLTWRHSVLALWLIGAALLAARLGWFVMRLRRELRGAMPVTTPAVLDLLDRCREQMRVRDRLTLLETPLVNSPALCGFWRPRLLLPPGLLDDFTPQQLRFIFLHELAHVRRYDIVANWLITLLQILHWFNPLVWLAFSRLRADRELACDALALSVAAPGEQHAYGQTIIKLLEGFARPSAAMPGLVGILEDKNQMKQRIRMIAKFRRDGRWAWLSGIVAALLGIVCLTDAQPEPAVPVANVLQSDSVGQTPSLVVRIESKAPHLYLDNAPVTIEDLRKELRARSASNPNLRVELQMDKQAPFRVIVEVLDAAELAKVKTVYARTQEADSVKSSSTATTHSIGKSAKGDPSNTEAASSEANQVNLRISGTVIDAKTNQTNLVRTSAKRRELMERLERIVLPRVEFDAVPLPKVIEELAKEARQHDPQQRGVNFMLSAPLAEVTVVIHGVQNISLGGALGQIVRGASQPIRFSVEDYGVNFAAADETQPLVLFTRSFKVDPNTFARALGELIGDGLTNSPPTVARLPSSGFTNAPGVTIERLRWFLSSTGADLVPPKSVFYNDRLGMLMVRATMRDLEIIEQAIQVLNQSPPQVSIEVKFAEVSSDDADGKAFLSLIGFNAADTNVVPAKPRVPRPGDFVTGLESLPASDRSLRGGVLNTGSNLPPPVFTSILKADQFRAILRALEKRKGVELLSTPKVTTLSGRLAQIKAVEVKWVVTDIDTSPAPDSKPRPIAEPFELGPVLDVVPYVSADGSTIQMTIIPTIKEFLGYDREAAEVIQAATGNPTLVPLPMFRLRQVIANANVADGQTVVLSPGAVEVEDERAGGTGRASRKPLRKHLLIFVTPTIIDPAGNPVHGENSRP